MSLDIPRLIGAVTRELTTRDVDGTPARVVVATRTYDTTQDDLWDAITNAERIPRWFMPITGDLRLGGRFQLQGNAGGEILVCDRPEFLRVTWEYGGQVSWVEVRLTADARSGTELRLEHIAHVPKDFWDQFGAGAVGVGWDSALLGLDQLHATHASVRPEDAMTWLVSDEGREFVTRSSEAWCAASIAAGEDPGAARAAALRTRAAYTGEAGAATEG
jgi:uncharacterized protein YndB with AHSA1/START domain